MLKTRRNRVMLAIIAILLVVFGMLATTAFSRKILEPSIFAQGSGKMPGIGDYVSLGDLEVRVDEVDKPDPAEAEESMGGYHSALGGVPIEAITGCLAEPRTSSGDDEDAATSGTSGAPGDTELVLMKVTFRNNGDSPVDFRETTPPTMNLQTVNGTRATPACGTLVEAAPEDQIVEPGETLPGVGAYRVPAGEDPGWSQWTDPDTGQTATIDVGGGDEAPDTCEAADLDLSETELGPFLSIGELPLADSGFTHVNNLRLVDNQFDPCAPLSWVTLVGSPTGSDPEPAFNPTRTAVVFFTGDHLADFDMSVYQQLGEVRRTRPDEVTLSYNTYRNMEDPFLTVPYTPAGAGDPDEPPLANGRINFDTAALSDDSPFHKKVPLPYGNVHSAAPLEDAWLDIEDRNFRTEAGGVPVVCSVANDAGVSCWRDSGTWSLENGTASDYVDISFVNAMPDDRNPRIEFYTEHPSGNRPREGKTLTIPPGSRVMFHSAFIVDTTDGTLRISLAFNGSPRVLQLDSEQVQDLPVDDPDNPYGLDTSRWA